MKAQHFIASLSVQLKRNTLINVDLSLSDPWRLEDWQVLERLITQQKPTRLQCLYLGGYKFDQETAQIFERCLSSLPGLRILDLSYVQFIDERRILQSITKIFSLRRIESLDLSHFSGDIEHLAALISSCGRLKTLNLASNQLGLRDWSRLSFEANLYLNQINLQHNDLKSACMGRLATLLRACPIKDIDLSNNPLYTIGCREFLQKFGNKSCLRSIDLSATYLDDEILDFFSVELSFASYPALGGCILTGNPFTPKALQRCFSQVLLNLPNLWHIKVDSSLQDEMFSLYDGIIKQDKFCIRKIEEKVFSMHNALKQEILSKALVNPSHFLAMCQTDFKSLKPLDFLLDIYTSSSYALNLLSLRARVVLTYLKRVAPVLPAEILLHILEEAFTEFYSTDAASVLVNTMLKRIIPNREPNNLLNTIGQKRIFFVYEAGQRRIVFDKERCHKKVKNQGADH